MHFGKNKNRLLIRTVIVGIAINVILCFAAYIVKLPIYLDTIGTIAVAVMGGAFPGIMTAVISNTICVLFDNYSVYYGIVNIIIALTAAWFVRYRNLKGFSNLAAFTVITGAASGLLGAVIQLYLSIGTSLNPTTDAAEAFAALLTVPRPIALATADILMNIIDKGLSLAAALLLVHFIPEGIKQQIRDSGWMQRPIALSDERVFVERRKELRTSLQKRLTFNLIASSLIIAFFVTAAGVNQHFIIEKQEKKENAYNAAKFAASVVDVSKINSYLKNGEAAEGYPETENMLAKIRENAPGVMYVYILKIEEDHSTFIFDLDAMEKYAKYAIEGGEGYEPGDEVPIEEDFEPYMDDLLHGRPIPFIESNAGWNWIVTAYYPVLDEHGQCVCYAGADASIDYIADYSRDFILRIILLLSGIMIAIIAYEIRLTGRYIYFPISKTVTEIENFVSAGSDQQKMDAAVKELRRVDVSTGDEVEKLYREVCRLATNQAEQIRAIRKYTDATSKMQDGLIVTMADLVDSRDSDTGAHVQKTAAYVKIIVEGLKKKGYYPEKITPKFMSDVVRSAPLHDIGKINISDAILNKPGRLTEEEYAIMKTHTTAGNHIMEKVISTLGGENYLKEARNMASYHHERWDGKGYPEGLHGEVIPLSARIMAVADVFDALTSSRVYKPPYSMEQAISMLQEGAGTQFDPKCVEVFMEAIPEIKVILRKYNQDV